MKAFLLVALFASVALALEVAPMARLFVPKHAKALAPLTEEHYAFLFNKWADKFNRTYETEEELDERYVNFKHNLDFVRQWNNEEKGSTMAVNQFGDWSMAEYKAKMLGFHKRTAAPGKYGIHYAKANETLASTVDWRTKGAVTHVKNQGQCGSCWSFSTTGSIEGAHAISTGKLVSLSEQNLMDCSDAEGNQSCEGGLMDQAFQYVIQNNGIDTEASYPYQAQDESQCNYNPSNSGATISGYTDVNSGDENALKSAVNQQPVSVAIDANHNSFMSYSSGVLTIPTCSSTQLDHGVLAIGYGTQDGQDYWIVKNSWGTSWGMSGYVFMRRNYNNMCGIATSASYPTGAQSK